MALIEMSVSAAIMIVIALLLRRQKSKRISKTSILNVWNLILLRALLPFQIPLGELPFLKSALARVETVKLPAVASDVPIIELEGTGMIQEAVTKTWGIWELLTLVWVVGMVYMLICFLRRYYLQAKVLNDYDYLPVSDQFMNKMVEDSKIRRKITIHYNQFIETPVTMGILRPKILIPIGFEKISKKDIRNIFLHELVHIRRFDVAMRIALELARCIHWFNPLIREMQKYFLIDQEMSCDEQVLKQISNKQKKSYAESLLRMGIINSEDTFQFPAFQEGKNILKTRIYAVVNYQKMGAGGIAIVALAFGCSLITFASFDAPVETVVEAPNGQTDQILAEEETEKKQNEEESERETTKEKSKDKVIQPDKATVDNKTEDKTTESNNKEAETEMETETSEAETEFEKMSYEEYERK